MRLEGRRLHASSSADMATTNVLMVVLLYYLILFDVYDVYDLIERHTGSAGNSILVSTFRLIPTPKGTGACTLLQILLSSSPPPARLF